jgi:phage-related protein
MRARSASRFQAVYYRTKDGVEPVRDFIESRDPKLRVTLRSQIGRLNLLDDTVPHLPFPHSSQIEGGLRELRCHHGSDLYRLLYRRSERLLVLLHVFPKRTAKVPASEIEIAKKRWKDFKERMDADPRVPPRAAGRDAP